MSETSAAAYLGTLARNTNVGLYLHYIFKSSGYESVIKRKIKIDCMLPVKAAQ